MTFDFPEQMRSLLLALVLGMAAGFHAPSSAVVYTPTAAASPATLLMRAPATKPETKARASVFARGKVAPTKNTAGKKEVKKEDGENLMQKVKDAGSAGIISYIFWEWAFWGVSVPVAISAFYGLQGHFPDFSNQEDLTYLGGEAFAFVNLARFAVPLRIGLALGTTPWVQANIVDRFNKDKKDKK